MNFSWLHPLFVEKANDDSLLVAVEHFEKIRTESIFSQKRSGLETRSWGEELSFMK
jgi:hypothetical protein